MSAQGPPCRAPLRAALLGALALVWTLAAPARAHADALPPSLRVTAELHAGALSIAAGAGLGLLLSGTEASCGSQCKGAWTMVGGAIGLVASPFATLAVAELLGGPADLVPTVLGFLAGMQLDALLTVLVHKLVGTSPGDVPTLAWVLAATVAIAAPLAGSAVGAEW